MEKLANDDRVRDDTISETILDRDALKPKNP